MYDEVEKRQKKLIKYHHKELSIYLISVLNCSEINTFSISFVAVGCKFGYEYDKEW